MRAKVTYELRFLHDPWHKKQPAQEAWFLCRMTSVGGRQVAMEPVAIFNLDSEAENFTDFLEHGGRVQKVRT